MSGNVIIQIVASQSTPEKEAEFNRWYSDVHVPMFFGYEGLKRPAVISVSAMTNEAPDIWPFMSSRQKKPWTVLLKARPSPPLWRTSKSEKRPSDLP
jgi:hypothetical protein